MDGLGTKTLQDWLTDLENRYSNEIQLGLDRIKRVAEKLTLTQSSAKIVTVGGTNGKGSTVALLTAIYVAAGYQVGSYFSPHVREFNERIKINNQSISDNDLIIAFETIDAARGEIPLTYFEMTTLAALWHFKNNPLDIVILEVGLGGRLDATNIIDSDLAIITTIAKDHEAFLGDTLEAIGFEKAGILRTQKPAIYADTQPPNSILAHARELGVLLFINGKDYSYHIETNCLHLRFNNQETIVPLPAFHPNSTAAALMAMLTLIDTLPVTSEQCQLGILNAHLEGRQQFIQGPVKTMIDVAHNPQSVEYLAKRLMTRHAGEIHAVFSALIDKDITAMLAIMKPAIDHWYPALLTGQRATAKDDLQQAFIANEIPMKLCYNSPVLAYQAACERATANDLIVVFGSFLMASAILESI